MILTVFLLLTASLGTNDNVGGRRKNWKQIERLVSDAVQIF